MGNEKYLKPITSSQRARELGSKGGKVRSDKKKLAAKIRELKKSKITDKKLKEICALMESPELSNFEIMHYLMKMKTAAGKDVEDMNKVCDKMLKWHKQQHGTNDLNLTQVNVNNQPVVINVVEDAGELEAYSKTNKSKSVSER